MRNIKSKFLWLAAFVCCCSSSVMSINNGILNTQGNSWQVEITNVNTGEIVKNEIVNTNSFTLEGLTTGALY